jgi:hypothetical protein
MTLTGTVQTANDGLLGVDVDDIVTATDAANLFADGFPFCARYIVTSRECGSRGMATSPKPKPQSY